MHRLRTWSARRWLWLSAGCAALALLGVWLAQRTDDVPRAPQDTAAQAGGQTDGAPADRAAVSKTDGGVDQTPPPQPYGDRLVPDGYRWGDPHPWLAEVDGEPYRRYVGPQTAEAIFAVMSSGHSHYQQEDEAKKLLEHYRYILARGAVIRDNRDAVNLGQAQADNIDRWRENPNAAAYHRRFNGLPADATLQELQDAHMDRWIKIWPPMKEQFAHARKTGETTLNITLLPDGRGSGAIGINAVGREDGTGLTDVEKYNISRRGIAPEGYRLRFVDEDKNELPFDQVPFFRERDQVKHWSDADLEEALVALPAFMEQPDALEEPDIVWMSMVDRYEAALAEHEARRQAAALSARPPAAPTADGEDGAPARLRPAPEQLDSGAPPVQQRETEPTEARAKREAFMAAAKTAGVRRAAEAYIEALAKLGQRKDISPEAQEKLARRIMELRAFTKAPPEEEDDEDDE